MMEREKKLVIIESEKDIKRQDEVDKLLKNFEKELMPLGVSCKNWAKPR